MLSFITNYYLLVIRERTWLTMNNAKKKPKHPKLNVTGHSLEEEVVNHFRFKTYHAVPLDLILFKLKTRILA